MPAPLASGASVSPCVPHSHTLTAHTYVPSSPTSHSSTMHRSGTFRQVPPQAQYLPPTLGGGKSATGLTFPSSPTTPHTSSQSPQLALARIVSHITPELLSQHAASARQQHAGARGPRIVPPTGGSCGDVPGLATSPAASSRPTCHQASAGHIAAVLPRSVEGGSQCAGMCRNTRPCTVERGPRGERPTPPPNIHTNCDDKNAPQGSHVRRLERSSCCPVATRHSRLPHSQRTASFDPPLPPPCKITGGVKQAGAGSGVHILSKCHRLTVRHQLATTAFGRACTPDGGQPPKDGWGASQGGHALGGVTPRAHLAPDCTTDLK
jgi:hypothetical protein